MTDIRPAAADDAAGIAAVHVASFESAYAHLPSTRRSAREGIEERTRVWRQRIHDPSTRTLAALEGGEVAGFVHVGTSPDPDAEAGTGHVHSIHVSPHRSGRGIGTRLMEEAERELREAGHTAATLWVVIDNQAARRFYEGRGWRADGATRREVLAVGAEPGDEVEVVRYRLPLDTDTGNTR